MFALKSNFSKAGHSRRISDVEAFEPRVHGLPDHPRGGQEPLCLSDGPILHQVGSKHAQETRQE